MPRQARLDAPGVLQHVMARGIERRKIFKDDKDRQSFLDRLAIILEKTQTQCYAWALIPNHFHLLLRTGATPLSNVMRRLMTGYAVTFNRRHKRAGHLFQNRYKSVVCEEDPYLLELIRYIHLNPLRAKIVEDLKALDKYPWTGHSTILGRRKNPLMTNRYGKNGSSAARRIAFSQFRPGIEKTTTNPENPVDPVKNKSLAEKTIEDILLHFGNTVRIARRRYRQFVKSGIEQGRRPELQGGGLVRSAGGNKVGILGRKKEEREKGDARILGDGDFVSDVLHQANELEGRKQGYKLDLEELVKRVSHNTDIEIQDLLSSKRERRISHARGIVCYLAVLKLGYELSEVGKMLGISRKSVSRCIRRGEKSLDNENEIDQYCK